MPEIIYILINETMPGYVKVGKTCNNLEQRIKELSSSKSVLSAKQWKKQG